MQIVIDIGEEIYDTITSDTMPTREELAVIVTRIYQGIVLPKGHGDLIDRSQIKWFGCDFESFKNCHIVNDDCSICSHATCLHDDVMSLPKVIPADKEDTE